MSSKPGRNEPCPCGSGQKYKRCCLTRDEAARAEASKQQALWHDEDVVEDDDGFLDCDDEGIEVPTPWLDADTGGRGRERSVSERRAAVVEVDLTALRKLHRRQRGTCQLCGVEVTASGAGRHHSSCAPVHDATTGPAQTLIRLRVTAPGLPAYWLDLEMRGDAKLEALDRFLRHIWLECCGHLSRFEIGDVEFSSLRDDFGLGGIFGSRRVRRGMGVRLAEALQLTDQRFRYEYDFGSTTALQLDVRSRRAGRIGARRFACWRGTRHRCGRAQCAVRRPS